MPMARSPSSPLPSSPGQTKDSRHMHGWRQRGEGHTEAKKKQKTKTKEGAPDASTALSTQAGGSGTGRKPALQELKGNGERNAISSAAVSPLLPSGTGDSLRWNILF